jgi:hypothetical protein
VTLQRLQELARDAVYEPGRGEPDDAPEPIRGEARELRARLDGDRLFYATDDNGELCGLGVMAPGGRIVNIKIGLLARMDIEETAPRLKVVG